MRQNEMTVVCKCGKIHKKVFTHELNGKGFTCSWCDEKVNRKTVKNCVTPHSYCLLYRSKQRENFSIEK